MMSWAITCSQHIVLSFQFEVLTGDEEEDEEEDYDELEEDEDDEDMMAVEVKQWTSKYHKSVFNWILYFLVKIMFKMYVSAFLLLNPAAKPCPRYVTFHAVAFQWGER